MLELKPLNKYIVIKVIAQSEKIGEGLLYAPGNALAAQYRMATVIAVSECDETTGLEAGQTILYDTIGEVNHRVGKQTITTVLARNVIGIVNDIEVPERTTVSLEVSY